MSTTKNAPPGSATVHQALEQAMRHHAAGDLRAAEGIYQQVLRTDPNQPVALHLLGLIAHQVGKNDVAADLMSKALAVKPDYAEAYCNLGLVLQALGRLDDAVASFKRSLKINPGAADVHNNLGNALYALRKLDAATDSYQQAIDLHPGYLEAHYNLGNVFKDERRMAEAAESYRHAIEIKPDFAEAHANLAYALQEQEQLDDAIAHYQQSLALKPAAPDVLANLGVVLNMCGRRDEALAAFEAALEHKRGPGVAAASARHLRATNKAKLRHDIEQFEYLASLGKEAEKYQGLAAAYRTVLDEVAWPESDSQPVLLNDAQLQKLQGTYNRPVHRATAPALPGSSLNAGLDPKKITADYFSHSAGATYFDGFLSDEALTSLRRYLLQSTIWFECKYAGGYLGAMLGDGLACPLLLQIADDLAATFPDIFKDHKLKQLWAYKYDSRLTGIAMHADFAAVNVNFWITPDEANLNPESGGLVVYDAEAPMDWDFKTYNTDQERIHAFLAEQKSGKIVAPHRQNRMVMFNSDLFHATDTIEFKEGFENRRINVTMLFGHRDV